MIIIDDERVKLDPKYKGDDALLTLMAAKLREINEKFDSIERMGNNSVRIKWNPIYVKKHPTTGLIESKACTFIPFHSSINVGGGTREVIYAESSQKVDGEIKYFPYNEMFTGSKLFTRNDTELLLWYLMFAPQFKTGDIQLDDIEKEASVIATKRKQNVDLEFYLYSDVSPLDDERVKVIANIWGINVEKYGSMDLLKNKLHDTILTEEGRKPGTAITEFKKQTMGLTDEMKAISIVSRGLFKKVIKFNHAESQWEWTEDNSPILKIPVNERGDEMILRKRLASFLIAAKKLYQLKEALNITDDEDLEQTSIDVTFDKYTDWDKLNFIELKRALKNISAPFDKKDKQEKLIELCREAYKTVEP